MVSKIVIGIPCYGSVPPEVLGDYMRFAFYCGRFMPEYHFHLAIVPKSEQFRARNNIVDAAMHENADYLLFMDDDMIVDIMGDVGVSDSYSFLKRLLDHDKDIIGALYYQRTGGCRPVLMKATGAGYQFLDESEIKHGLQRVDVAGGGCMLVKMRVFDRIKQPYFVPETNFGTDIQLCRAAAEAGFEVWADTSIELGHVRNERIVITSRNRHQFALDATPGEVKRFIQTDVFNTLIEDAEEWTGIARSDFATAAKFVERRNEPPFNKMEDARWYMRFPKERVARQVWFNTEIAHKRSMTEFILSSITHTEPHRILDYGCGIGITAFELARKGHRVTASDYPLTGTYLFLRWRAKKHGVPVEFTPADVFARPEAFDIIIAMDCLEHMENWRETLAQIASALRPAGVLFANNAILDDTSHPEHYPLKPIEFVRACADLGLMPMNQIAYRKAEIAKGAA